ncbi:non-ribosomal peptide synthetase [Microcoleus vaginatus GB1-A2]|uniref:non-ribosomal peptide synthetase n=1 Tax=Microcoleus vaginatus TaxID=119532 RepID=UPI0016830279|nr:amino acid adenylation domain-containing protein [Microcoleus sp. FACHB-61]
MSYLKLSAKKRALLEVMLREKGVESSTARRIPKRKEGDSIPLSFAQQRLWFFDQFEAGKSFYNLPGAIRLKGKLNVAVLEQTFNEILNRHEALRSTFTEVQGQPIQVIAPPGTRLRLPVIDLRELPQSDRDAAVKQLSAKEAQQPFDLERGPLLRTSLLQLSEEEYVLLLTMHHIVSDGWSIGVLARELAAIYEALSAGNQPQLPELPVQYADFAIWQRNWLCGEVLQTQLAYWKQQLEGAPPLLELPADRPRPPILSSEGATQSLLLSQELTAALKNLSQREDVTLFMTLLAAFKALLYRYTGRTDLLVGSPIANRNRAEIEGLIGVFVNTLVLRTDVSGDPTFRELLQRLREVTLGAYAHQDLPFEKLVEELQPERSLSYNPVFQVMFQLRNNPMPPLDLPGLTLSMLDLETNTTQFDLSLDLEEVGERLQASVQYSTDLFDRATITRMLGHLQTLLEGIAANPEQRLSSLPLLTAAEKQQLLQWNNTFAQYPQDKCIHQLFEEAVERSPDAVAVVFEGEELSYRELNARANQLARHLRSLGVEAEVLVGICVERSPLMVIGLLGVLKAGGAYVPLDPNYPKERLAFMLEDSSVQVLLAQEKLLEKLPPHSARVVCLDSGWEEIAFYSSENPRSGVKPENLAYVIYTSGSTGKPKGVLIEHRSLVNYTTAAIAEYGIEKRDRVLQFASISFDASAEEIYPCLTSGATLVLRTDSMLDSAGVFWEKCRTWNLTVLSLPTAYWHELTALLSQETLVLAPSLRLTIIGGEKALPERLKTWIERVGQQVRLVNTYGPTEATVVATICELSAADATLRELPIGRPIGNVQTYILDCNGQPVPTGIPGELHVGGAGLARGYLNRPELTEEKFIPSPFSNKPGSRLYKTGDLTRYRPDGNIEYVGRIDNQVKIRGFRIELAEIEAVLSQHPAVRESAVLVWFGANARKRLVAYVVPNARVGAGTGAPPLQLSSSELRQFLQQRLPEYMVPSAFVMLESLPLTPNGKVDRKALPAPERDRPELEEAFAAPSTAIEKILAEIWAQVLGLEQVGIDDNFFELGGDSILSIQVISKANQAGLRLTPKQLFQHQTIAQLAAVADTAQPQQSEQGLIIGEVPLTPIQHWFFEQNLSDPHHWNQAVLLELRQPLEPALIESVLQELLKHHDALRLRFARGEAGWQQELANPDELAPFTCIDLSSLPPEEREGAFQTAATQLQASLNLSEGPLLRAALFDLGKHQPNRLLLAIHHLAVDGVSWRILIEDFQTAYGQISRGETVALPPKTTSFKQWAERLHEWARSPELQAEFDYWFAFSHQPTSRLPIDFPTAANLVASEKTVSVALSVEETKLLLQEVPAAYRTQINDVLLTALGQAFERWTGNNSLLLDLEGHGREDLFEGVDLSRTIGWFTAVFPVLLNLEKPSDLGAAIKSVKEQLRAVPNRGVGFGVQRYLNPETAKNLQKLPQAEVSFNYLGQFDQVLPKSSLLMLSSEPSGPIHSPRGNRCYLLEINGFIASSKLQLDWTYSENFHRRESIENLATGFIESLRSLIQYCQSPDAGGCTPSDFAEFKWSQWGQDDLDNITAILGEL